MHALEHELGRVKRSQQEPAPGSEPRTRVAELGAEIAELREHVERLRGELEQTRHLAERALAAARAERPPRAAGPVPAEEAVSPPVPAASGDERSVPADPGSRYEQAYRLYRAGDLARAIARFEELLSDHPTSDLADNALFWLGESHYKLGDRELAAVTFDRVAREYPDGNKVPDALYRQGIALMEIGERKGERAAYDAAAAEVFRRIVSEHPDSDRVDETRRKLEELELR